MQNNYASIPCDVLGTFTEEELEFLVTDDEENDFIPDDVMAHYREVYFSNQVDTEWNRIYDYYIPYN